MKTYKKPMAQKASSLVGQAPHSLIDNIFSSAITVHLQRILFKYNIL